MLDQNITYNNKIISNEPKNLNLNVFDEFFEERCVKIERVKIGRASPEKGDIM